MSTVCRIWVPMWISGILLIGAGDSVGILTKPRTLEEIVDDATWIFHVTVKKLLLPFSDEGNEMVILAICDVQNVIKASVESDPLLPISLNFESDAIEKVIIGISKRRDLCPIDKGKEYLVFTNDGGAVATVVGRDRIFEVHEGKVLVSGKYVPESSSEVHGGGDDFTKILVPLEKFIERIKELIAES